MRPLSLAVPSYTTDRHYGSTMDTPAIETASWRQDAENEVAFIFANPTDSSHSDTVDITLSEYGITGGAILEPIDDSGRIAGLASVTNSFTKTIDLSAQSVEAWIISKQNII